MALSIKPGVDLCTRVGMKRHGDKITPDMFGEDELKDLMRRKIIIESEPSGPKSEADKSARLPKVSKAKTQAKAKTGDDA